MRKASLVYHLDQADCKFLIIVPLYHVDGKVYIFVPSIMFLMKFVSIVSIVLIGHVD